MVIDGKTSRRTDKMDATPLHLVSAFAAGAGLVLGQRATAEKSNEKTAIPELLATLALDGCIVTTPPAPNLAGWRSTSGNTYFLLHCEALIDDEVDLPWPAA